VARAVLSLIGSSIFVASVYRTQLAGHFRFSYSAAREMALASPSTAAGGLSYALMNQSEGALIGFFLRPELVPSYTLTRKGADVLGSLLNMIGFASYGGFAHLVGSAQRHRAWQVLAEITSLRYSLSIAAAAAVMALNPSFVSLWVGPEMYGGHWLTVFMALQMIFTGGAYLMNYLYRACGPVVKGSLALVVESLIRVPLMIVLLRWLGVIGIPLAGILTSLAATVAAYLWVRRELSQYSEHVSLFTQRVEWARLGVLLLGTAACVWMRGTSWTFVLGTGTAVVLVAAALLISIDPLLGDLRRNMKSVMHSWTAVLG
jgi:O-antigen/teichoic acid export membrane protein